jgi:hypothetical protein
MSQYRFELATPADWTADADLRHILAETPMDGPITVSFRREPSYFQAAVVDGPFRQVVAARDMETGHYVGFGSRAVRELYANGRPANVGYLSLLRLLAEHRNQGLVARGYVMFRKLHADGKAPLYVTTISESNTVALTTLTSGRAGLPAYHFAGRYHTVIIGARRRWPVQATGDISVRPANIDDWPAILAFLNREGPRRQFFPVLGASDFFTAEGAYLDLRPEEVLLAERGGVIVGTLAGWDQSGFKQTVVHGYRWPLNWLRPLVNVVSWLRGQPLLPKPGRAFGYLTAALPVVANDDAGVFRALLDRLLARTAAGPWPALLVGLHEADPLLAVLSAYRPVRYITNLYLVCWADGDEMRTSLDGRPPYLELGTL